MSRTTSRNQAATAPSASPTPRIRGNRIGRCVGWTDDAQLLVDFPGNRHGPLPARSVISFPAAVGERTRTVGREVLLAFESERSDRPIVLGLLDTDEPFPAAREPGSLAKESVSPTRIEARVDGRLVVVEAQDEIVLKCGQASITLRRNGRVVVRGTYVETRARGVNRIRGGSVEIN